MILIELQIVPCDQHGADDFIGLEDMVEIGP